MPDVADKRWAFVEFPVEVRLYFCRRYTEDRLFVYNYE